MRDSMDFRFKFEELDNRGVLYLSGRLTDDDLVSLRSVLQNTLALCKFVKIDLEKVTEISKGCIKIFNMTTTNNQTLKEVSFSNRWKEEIMSKRL